MSPALRTLAITVAAALSTAVLSAAIPSVAVAAGDPDTAAWERTGRPERLMVIRPGTVALVSRGTVVRRLYPQAGALPLSWLVANAGHDWVARSSGGGTAAVQMKTAVLLTPGTTLRIGPDTAKVLFTAGRTAASGTWIRGSRAGLEVRDATLGSVGEDGNEPAAGDAAGRPYILMGAGGRLDLDHSTVTGFGLPGTGPGLSRFSGVTWGKGSTGSAVGSSFVGNRTGLRLAGSTGVKLSDVTVKGSLEDGVVLNKDAGTVIEGLASQDNGRNGLTAGGTDDRALTGVGTSGNRGSGIKATAQSGLRLTGVTSQGDQGGGIRLVSCAACTVDTATVHGAPVALAVSGAGSQVAVVDPRFSSGTTGITLAAGIGGATVSGGTVQGFERGIAVSGSAVSVRQTAVSDSLTGVSVYGQAHEVSLRGVTVRGGRVGVTASDTTSAVTLTDVRVSGTTRKGLSSASPGLRVTGGSVSGATTAVDLGASARLDTLTISGARRGLHLAAGVHATGTALDVLAERKGIEVGRGARMDLTDSRVRAPIALFGPGDVHRIGHTRVTLPPFPWLGFAALLALTLAAGLQTVHQVRHRRTPTPQVASHVRNTA
ncbi:right-handed parallel beta-helix repeat-containing protein [Streptomyces sp. NPDC058691]|uniref:right-handed parallel beta-helix repeat-containing protein n=1 Tax=Streptomyces sp. NPDC058691 TaxID=3346601 RepID=UPI0036491734